MAKIDKRDLGLNHQDRIYIIEKKFGIDKVDEVEHILSQVKNKTDRVLGAILFISRDGDFEDLNKFSILANDNEMQLRTIATVKYERVTGQLKT